MVHQAAVKGGGCIPEMDLMSYFVVVHLCLTEVSGMVVKQKDFAAYRRNPARHLLQSSLLRTAIPKRFVRKPVFPCCALPKHQYLF